MTPNDDSKDEELLARYRRASDSDAAAPSDAVRAAILAESRRVAEELAKQAPQHSFDVSRPAANDSRWKITAFGTVGAALLAVLLFVPRYWENAPPVQSARVPASTSESASAPESAPPAPTPAQVQAPKLEEVKPYVAPSNSAPAPQPPSDATSVQEIVVTQANRKSSRSSSAPALNPPVPAPTPPPSAAQNYAPVTNSISPLAAAPPAAAERARQRDRSALAAENDSQSVTAGFAARADSAQKPATLESAVARGDVAQTASLLDQGAVIDARDQAGRTPLMLAVIQGRLEVVRLLLARGADPNAADNTGHTPLQQAKERNAQDIAALLEAAGARR